MAFVLQLGIDQQGSVVLLVMNQRFTLLLLFSYQRLILSYKSITKEKTIQNIIRIY